MKVEELGQRLERCASALASASSNDTVQNLKAVTYFLAQFRGKSLAQLMKAAESCDAQTSVDGSVSLAEAFRSCAAVLSIAQIFDSRKSITDEMQSLCQLFQIPRWRGRSLADLSKALEITLTTSRSPRTGRGSGLQANVVAEYIAKLESALGDSSFDPVFEALTKDKRVRKEEAAAIASQFVSKTPKSAKKADSLQRIRSRNDNIVDSIRKREALRGRSAA